MTWRKEKNKMSDESNEYEKEIRIVKKYKKKYNYKIQDIDCCAHCSHSQKMSIEDELLCIEYHTEKYDVNSVDEFGICDKFNKFQ